MREEKDIYIEKLSKKDTMYMTFQELQDWLDHCIYDKMQYHTFNEIQKDTFNHLLRYFRLNRFALQLIMAKAENCQYFIKSIMLLLKEKNPELVNTILEMVENMTKEHNLELVKDETPEDAQRIIDKANELQEEFKKQGGF
jgi:hypothetical protein